MISCERSICVSIETLSAKIQNLSSEENRVFRKKQQSKPGDV